MSSDPEKIKRSVKLFDQAREHQANANILLGKGVLSVVEGGAILGIGNFLESRSYIGGGVSATVIDLLGKAAIGFGSVLSAFGGIEEARAIHKRHQAKH